MEPGPKRNEVYFPLRDHAQPDVVSWSHGSGEKEEKLLLLLRGLLGRLLGRLLSGLLGHALHLLSACKCKDSKNARQRFFKTGAEIFRAHFTAREHHSGARVGRR